LGGVVVVVVVVWLLVLLRLIRWQATEPDRLARQVDPLQCRAQRPFGSGARLVGLVRPMVEALLSPLARRPREIRVVHRPEVVAVTMAGGGVHAGAGLVPTMLREHRMGERLDYVLGNAVGYHHVIADAQ
jgi:hypothetical protein